MTAVFTNGRIVDLILAMMALEALGLLVYRHRTGRGIAPAGLLINLLSGACLLMALRCALLTYPWHWTATWLAAALIAHLADLSQRWR